MSKYFLPNSDSPHVLLRIPLPPRPLLSKVEEPSAFQRAGTRSREKWQNPQNEQTFLVRALLLRLALVYDAVHGLELHSRFGLPDVEGRNHHYYFHLFTSFPEAEGCATTADRNDFGVVGDSDCGRSEHDLLDELERRKWSKD